MEWSLKQIVKRFSEAKEYQEICWKAKLTSTVPVTNAWRERGGSAIKTIKTRNRSSMKYDFLNALFTWIYNLSSGPRITHF